MSEANLHNWKAMEKRGVFKERPGKQIINRTPGASTSVTASYEMMCVVQNGNYELEVKSEDFSMKQSGKVRSAKALRETIETQFLNRLSH